MRTRLARPLFRGPATVANRQALCYTPAVRGPSDGRRRTGGHRLLFWGEEFAIDLGTANVHVCVRDAGIVVREASAIAYNQARRAVAVGTEARRMAERGVPGVSVVRPLRGGTVANFDATVELLRHCIRAALGRRPILSPRVVVATPIEPTSVEYRALRDALRAAGAGKVYDVPRALAAAIGAAVPLDGPEARMVIDLGAGSTDIGILSLGAITAGTTLHYGGDDLDEAIRRRLRRAHGIAIGRTVAEEVKVQVGAVQPDLAQSTDKLRSLLGNGGGNGSALPQEEIPELLARALLPVVSEVRWLLEELPAKHRTEVRETGVVLTGGTALLGGIGPLFAERLELPVTVARDPLSCTVLGLESILSDLRALTLDGRRFSRATQTATLGLGA